MQGLKYPRTWENSNFHYKCWLGPKFSVRLYSELYMHGFDLKWEGTYFRNVSSYSNIIRPFFSMCLFNRKSLPWDKEPGFYLSAYILKVKNLKYVICFNLLNAWSFTDKVIVPPLPMPNCMGGLCVCLNSKTKL